jgi:hypothetical protein
VPKPSKPKQPPKASPAPPEEGRRAQVLNVRGNQAWKDWLVRFAEFNRSDMVDLIDDALVAYAKAKGFEAPPKR